MDRLLLSEEELQSLIRKFSKVSHLEEPSEYNPLEFYTQTTNEERDSYENHNR